MRLSAPVRSRPGATNPTVLVLGGVVALLLGVVLFLVLRGVFKSDDADDETAEQKEYEKKDAVKEGQEVKREDLDKDKKAKVKKTAPAPVGDSAKIRESLEVGKTYHVVQKAYIKGKGRDKRYWGTNDTVRFGDVRELVFSRLIKSNDGKVVVEDRTIDSDRLIRLFSGVDRDMDLDLGTPLNKTIFDGVTFPNIAQMTLQKPVKPLADAITAGKAGHLADDAKTKGYSAITFFHKKKARLTQEEGLGVTSVKALEGALTARDRDFLMNQNLLAHTDKVFRQDLKPGESWDVPAELLGDMFSQVFRSPDAKVSGKFKMKRKDDVDAGGEKLAVFEVVEGDSEVYVEEPTREGDFLVKYTLKPRGEMKFSIPGRYIRESVLESDVTTTAKSTGGGFSRVQLVDTPKVKTTYYCEKR